ncbi:MAG: PBP1A family penicillin-binding protein [Candidatus Krumholzibacteriota bacterium]|nr:PBP1A family penicillin-binding protein [Candidatus Krumholzibacteriota bacterium]
MFFLTKVRLSVKRLAIKVQYIYLFIVEQVRKTLKGGRSMRHRPLKKIEALILQILLLVAVVIIGIATAGYLWFSRDLPSMARLEMIEPSLKTRILAADSTTIREFYKQDRILLPLDEIPEPLKQAFLAVEDRRFYDHFGIDFIRIFSAAWKDIRHWRIKEGASTITQQLSTDLFLTKEQTFARKIKEILLAFRIERAYSKDEILELYLNQIYFGGGGYGVEAASQRFFGKSVKDLELHQIALLPGLPKNPTGYNPFRRPERALKRRAIVLRAMQEYGVITEAQLDTLKTKPLDVVEQDGDDVQSAPYFTEYIRQILVEKYGDTAVYSGGMTVYTTLDPYLQKVAEDSMETFITSLEEKNGYEFTRAMYLDSLTAGVKVAPDYLQSAAVAIDPRNGHIKVMVGGRNFKEKKFNSVIQARRQPGSAFKMFIYLAALEYGYSPSDILLDTPIVIEMPNREVYKPRNFSRTFHGAVSLRFALDKSINIPAVKLLQKLGGPAVINVAKRMGIRTPLMPYLSLALGAQEVTLLDLTSAFGVLATGGIRAEPMAILRIVDADGNILEDYRESQEEVLSAQIAYIMNDMMQTTIDEGTGRTARYMGLKIPCAGKTGTTDDEGDGWFIGYAPDLAVGVWTGFSHGVIPMGKNMVGAYSALPLWTWIMKAAHPGNTGPEFTRPDGISEAMICTDSGLLATPYCKNVRRELFIEGHEPSRTCDLHRISAYDLLDPDKDFREMDREASEEKELPRR